MMKIRRIVMSGVLVIGVLGVDGVGRPQTPQATPTNPPASVSQGRKEVYYCGARTKKGTACKHRVKKAGERCWQHKEAK